MRIQKRLLLAAGIVIATSPAAMVGCVGDDNAAPGPDSGVPFDGTTPHLDGSPVADSTAPTEDSPADSPPDTNLPDTNLPDAGPPPAKLRVAWLRNDDFNQIRVTSPMDRRARRRLPEWGPSTESGYDVCIRPHGTTQWQGPLLATVGERFTQGDVTQYQSVLAGQYDARIVEQTITLGQDAGAITCDDVPTGLADGGTTDYTNLPAVTPGEALTIVVTDPADANVAVADVFALVDETTTTAGKAKIRYVNAAGIGPSDYGLSGGVTFDSLFTNVSETTHLDTTEGDSQGYLEIDPIANIDTSIAENGSDDVSTPALSLSAGQIMTTFAVGVAGEGVFYAALNCMDGVASTESPLLTQCDFTTQDTPNRASQTRVADFIADDAFQADVCFKHPGASKFSAPVLVSRGLDAGVGLLDVSSYFALHGGFTYGVRLVTPGTLDCNTATPLAPDGTYASPVGTGFSDSASTMVMTGYAVQPDAGGPDGAALPSLAYLPFFDVDGNTDLAPSARVINTVANGTGPIGVTVVGDPNWTVANVPYGMESAPDPQVDGGPTPGRSYSLMPQQYEDAELELTTNEHYAINTVQTSYSLFLYSNGKGVSVLQCDDDADYTSGYWGGCTVLGDFFGGS